MLGFTVRRLVQAIPILFSVTLVAFFMVRLMPGDIADLLAPPGAPPEVRAQIAAIYGLDQPVWVQYLRWIAQLLAGNFGEQMGSGRPVAAQLFQAIRNTLQITLFAAFFGFTFGSLFGAIAARYNGRWPDRLFS